jgi:hypothetical protein
MSQRLMDFQIGESPSLRRASIQLITTVERVGAVALQNLERRGRMEPSGSVRRHPSWAGRTLLLQGQLYPVRKPAVRKAWFVADSLE